MKRLFTLIAISFTLVLSAQERPKISSAVIDLDQNNDVAGAKKYIDEAADIINSKDLSLVKEKDLTKFYYYYGMIYLRIASSSDEAISSLDDNPIEKTEDAFQKLFELEASTGKPRYGDKARQNLPAIANIYANRGLEEANNNEYEAAYEDFMKTYTLKKDFNLGTDTSMYYNAAIMAQNAKLQEKALEIYKDLISMNYKGLEYIAKDPTSGEEIPFPNKKIMDRAAAEGKVVDPQVVGDLRPDLYVTAANLYKEAGDTASFDATIAEGRTKFPENKKLLIAQLQQYLDAQEYDKALANLNEAIEKDPENVIMHYNKGVILQNEMNQYDEALAAYKTALEIDPEYSDALYMSSIIYIDRANKLGDEMNDLPLNAKTKYKQLEEKQTAIFKEALPYLEKAHKINPDDEQVTTALAQVYRALKMYEEAMALQKG